MAISATHYRLLCEHRHLLPQGGTLLEIGEAEWYGDIAPPSGCEASTGHGIAKAVYRQLFEPSRMVAIDMHGTPEALRLDLNWPIQPGHDEAYPDCPGNRRHDEWKVGFVCTCPGQPLGEQFDVVINHGTAEHIFNVAQVFRTMHDRCQTGGVMIHESPCTGWVDHGFYCLQPTLFYDLAKANCYEICGVWLEEIQSRQVIRLERREQAAQMKQAGKLPDNAMLFVIYRKIADLPFRIPTQGYYARSLSAEGVRAWEECR